MTHLVGCSLRAAAYAADPVESMFVEGERAELEKFKATYLANADASPSAVPQWELSRAEVEALPPSGWRALDDTKMVVSRDSLFAKPLTDAGTARPAKSHALPDPSHALDGPQQTLVGVRGSDDGDARWMSCNSGDASGINCDG